MPLLKVSYFKCCRAFATIYPLRDTEQNDPIGLEICKQNNHAMSEADLVLIYWDPESQGSPFDFGVIFGFWHTSGRPKIYLLNREEIEKRLLK
ncbi:MAG: hypothetical protein ACP5NE_02190 [Candidatus Micrarchaeia archaeon]